ncbi:MAG TPA: NAD(P)H-hydrate dehydratase [Candidatus Saccharimonadales bacterium]|nr:NAD(P)H-hydrate dehydratase [Candidatus Saccharimonadales bacterium]
MKNSPLPKRPEEGHKGTFGTVAVFAGQVSDKSVMLGSAVFAAKSALKSGVGLVDFFADKQTLVELVKMLPQAVGHTFKSFEEQSNKWSSVIVGPGWESTDENIHILERILSLKKPTVVDGEALNILAANPKMLGYLHPKCILTPHLKEFERLAKASDVSEPKEFAKKFGCILVLKSHETKVFYQDLQWEFEGNNPVLATGGTGDVLAGLIAGHAAQYYPKIDLFTCAQEAVKIHASAAEKYRQKRGDRGLIIDELIKMLSGY